MTKYDLFVELEKKKEMVRTIIKSFLHLKVASTATGSNGYQCWLVSIVDCLKNKRQFMKDNPQVAEYKSTVGKNTKAPAKAEDMP